MIALILLLAGRGKFMNLYILLEALLRRETGADVSSTVTDLFRAAASVAGATKCNSA